MPLNVFPASVTGPGSDNSYDTPTLHQHLCMLQNGMVDDPCRLANASAAPPGALALL